MRQEYKEHYCDFKNESECENELEEIGVSLEEAEGEIFGE